MLFSTAYEWFRALKKAGMYEAMREGLNDWIALLELDCTTCPETPKQSRSECHAWSALPVFEMMRTMAGVSSEGIGWERMRIEPHTMDLTDLQGKVVTPKGTVIFRYERTESTWHYFLELPAGAEAVFPYTLTGWKNVWVQGKHGYSIREESWRGKSLTAGE